MARARVFPFLACFMAAAPAASGEILCRYLATAPPEAHGWAAARTGRHPSADLAREQPGEPGTAWRIRDDSDEPGTLVYSRAIAAGDWKRLAGTGWKLTATLQVLSCDVASDNEKLEETTAQLELVPGAGGVGIRLAFSLTGAEYGADGESTVVGINGLGIQTLGRGYHIVEAVAKPAGSDQMEVRVRIDGRSRYSGDTKRLSDAGAPCLRWGSFGADGRSVTLWREIRLETAGPRDGEPPFVWEEKDFDYAAFARHFGAAFTIDAPQPESNMPLGKCAEVRRWGTRCALARPMINNMDDYFELYFALRKPPDYRNEDDVRISLVYRHSGALAQVLVDGDPIRGRSLPYQYKAGGKAGQGSSANELAAKVRATLAGAFSRPGDDAYYRAVPQAVEECVTAVDQILVGRKERRGGGAEDLAKPEVNRAFP